jgi:RNA polymerase sigma factor (sigma-70 family)
MSENSYLESYNSIIKKSKNLSAAEEKELFEKIKSSDPFISKRAREKIINNSLKLIIPLAQKFKTEKIDVGELFSIGLKGLIKSVGSFDPSKGFRFSTYATPNILQAITVYINQYNRFIRLPVNILADLRVINRVKNKLLYRFGSEPSNHDIFEELKNEGVKNITEEKINQYDSMVKNVY